MPQSKGQCLFWDEYDLKKEKYVEHADEENVSKKLPSENFMKKKSLQWKPYRTIACCYLWKTIDDDEDVW